MMIFKNLINEIDSIIERDPAAGSRLGVVFLYPTFHVMFFYKIGNIFWRYNLKFLGRMIMYFARIFTGIEIHPAAKIGNNVIIGSGAQILGAIKIGDNARIGANSVVSRNVPPNVTVAGVPAREFARSKKKETFKAYGISANDTDPREKILVDLLKKIENLEKKMKTLDNKKVKKNKIQKK